MMFSVYLELHAICAMHVVQRGPADEVKVDCQLKSLKKVSQVLEKHVQGYYYFPVNSLRRVF